AFKARPIKKDDFAKFLKTLKTGPNFVLEHEWSAIADNFLVAIERNQLNVNYCVDFQDLVRICHLIALCLTFNGEVPEMAKYVTPDLINAILTRPVLLPRAALKG